MIKSSKRETINASAAVLGHAGGTSTTRDDVTEYADKITSKLTIVFPEPTSPCIILNILCFFDKSLK